MRQWIAVISMIGSVLLCGALLPAHAAVKGEVVEYKADDTTLQGYLAYDDSIKKKRPGVLVVHEWWGHNEYARKRARMLAELGYIALAVDMYGDGKQAAHPQDAGKFAAEVKSNMQNAKARFMQAYALLQQHPMTDSTQIAAIGYCFGGGIVLEMARMGLDLDGVVSFHGSLATQSPAKTGAVKSKVLICHGADDPFVKAEQIKAFKQEMKRAGVDLTFKTYAGAKHAFTNPDADVNGAKFNLPLAYHAKADRRSWKDMQHFFDKIFKQK